ncbi:MAG: hypothetical protein FWF94_07025 [Oscillospiraceae bacterium]|nr:hypothetical protein [Oscillospiraceae bacterium]
MALFSTEIILDGEIPSTDAKLKWERAAESGARVGRVKGKALFLHSHKEHKYSLHYYQSYGKDLCDIMFTGEIFEYDEGKSQISGKITVSEAMKLFAWIIIIASFPLALLFNLILYYITPFVEGYMPFLTKLPETGYNGVFSFAGAAVALVIVGIMSLKVDKRKVKTVMDYLHEFLQREEEEKTK